MVITGILHIELHLPAAQSLKHKRSVIKSLKDKLHSRFNVSVAEVGYLDKWQLAEIAIACVSREQSYLESQFEKIYAFVDQEISGNAYITKSSLDFV
ncbi:DUF503 domain-containing protein [bacterium]|nr:DUF503 domain-containing protein [bacterium]